MLSSAVAAAILVMAALAALPRVPGVGLALLALGVALAVLDPDVRGPRRDGFVVAGGTFADPGGSQPVALALANICLVTACFADGVHETAGQRGPWIALLVAYTIPLGFYGYGAWRGTGVTLSPHGLRVAKLSGEVFVPWVALAPIQYAPVNPVILRVADPDLVRRSGRPFDTDSVTFPHTDHEFAAAAIRHYAAHPEARPTIGTSDGDATLRAAISPPLVDGAAAGAVAGRLEVPAHGAAVLDAVLPLPPTGRRRARKAFAGVLLLAVAVPLWIWVEQSLDRTSVGGLMDPLGIAVFGGFGLLISAAVGNHPRPGTPAPASSAPPSRAPWARDVTNG